MNLKLIFSCSLLAFSAAGLHGQLLIDENFNGYSDGPLSGQGDWARGPSSPTSDNPSNYIVVSSGAVLYDWTTNDPVNNLVRHVWGTGSGDALTGGSVFALFDLNVSQAPVASENLRPGFFSFASSDGSQQRGFVGLIPGGEADTFRIGVSSASQLQPNFTFHETDLVTNQSYQILIEYNLETAVAQVWIDNNPAATAAAGASAANIRRVNLRMNNSDGSTGVTDLGIFTVDNLQVATYAIPEPSHYALLLGFAAGLGILLHRRRKS